MSYGESSDHESEESSDDDISIGKRKGRNGSGTTIKVLKNWTPEKFAVIILKFEPFGFTIELNVFKICRQNNKPFRP